MSRVSAIVSAILQHLVQFATFFLLIFAGIVDGWLNRGNANFQVGVVGVVAGVSVLILLVIRKVTGKSWKDAFLLGLVDALALVVTLMWFQVLTQNYSLQPLPAAIRVIALALGVWFVGNFLHHVARGFYLITAPIFGFIGRHWVIQIALFFLIVAIGLNVASRIPVTLEGLLVLGGLFVLITLFWFWGKPRAEHHVIPHDPLPTPTVPPTPPTPQAPTIIFPTTPTAPAPTAAATPITIVVTTPTATQPVTPARDARGRFVKRTPPPTP